MENNQLIAGRAVFLRKFQVSDISTQYLSWLNNKNLMQYSNQRFMLHTRESAFEYWSKMQARENLFLAICDKNHHLLLGTITAHVSSAHQTANLGILIGEPSHRGAGLGREAWSLLSEYLFHKQGIRKICAGTLAVNRPMNGVAVSTGMILEGVLKDQELVNGIPVDMNLYGRLNPDHRETRMS